jgi:GNAT superfamily N-acetyltransferase
MTSPDGVRSGRVVSEVSVEQVGEDSLADQGDHVADRSAVPVAEPVVGPGTMVGLPGGSRAGTEVAGLGEFQLQGGGSLEITTFGLVPEYVGQGIGGNALTLVLQRAWRHNGVAASGCARRVQHPNALKTTTTAASG